VSNVHDITQPLLDSATLADMAKRAGVTLPQARMLAAMFADLPIRTAVRICTTAQLDRIRQSQREARKKR
jgi:hypothetical protein